MITIRDNSTELEIRLEGNITRVPTKRGYNEVTSIRGEEFSESIRGVVNLTINITHIDEDNYSRLETIFLVGTSGVEVEDNYKGVTYTNYSLKGDSLQLEELEDSYSKQYYYVGGLQLSKK